jgi:hypothetical protein
MMWPKKFHKLTKLRKSDPSVLEGRVLKCNIRLAESGTCRWATQITAIVDTGNQFALALPRNLIAALGFRLPVLGKDTMITASEEEVPVTIVAIDVQLVCDRCPFAVTRVPVAVLPEDSDPLIGLPLMDLFDYAVIGGRLTIFGPHVDALDHLEDWQPSERTTLVRSPGGCKLVKEGNVDPTDNKAKLPKRPPYPGMNITPLKDAFGIPAKPQGPKRSR